ncbi:putative flippase GtrA [Saccharomonospora amisosensis]|uniref:Putative flippase GtrA n=1 Tax=Saccharomonospora amisosensis TaxID=1128677 RepID=A0A7X5URG8_9PSEU|nr:GtrA family protein [Saccharomonospora amisosensis]NIJ12830.1 putative flippase GtrA [Saccharomonospora amisosensis]
MSPGSRTLLRRLARYGMVGAVNTAVYYGLYQVLRPGMPYLLAHVLAIAVTIVVSYFLNCRFTFRTRPSLRTFLLFPLSQLTNFAVSTVVLYLFVDWFQVTHRIAPLVASLSAVPASFAVAQLVLAGRRVPAHSATVPVGRTTARGTGHRG